MKRIAISIILGMISLSAMAQGFVKDSTRIDGQMRYYKMLIPEGMKEGAPMVVVCQGYGNSGNENTWMNEVAKKHGFALCMVIGVKDSRGKYTFNVGYPWQRTWKQDDVKAVCRIAAIAQKKYKLSKKNCFLTGLSNGGELCYIMAYSKQRTFKAFASVAGLTMEWVPQEREISRPVPFMEIHGTEDRTSEWTGDHAGKGGWGEYMAVPMAVAALAAKARATHEVTEEAPCTDPSTGRRLIRHLYEGSPTGTKVWLYEIVGGTHKSVRSDIPVGEEIWKFFQYYME